MKAFISISIIAAFLVALPPASPTKQPTDWSKVSSKLDELVKLVTETGTNIIDIAKKDNETIGVEMEKIMETEVPGLLDMLGKVRGDIVLKSLSKEKIRQYQAELFQAHPRVTGKIIHLFAKLSDSVQHGILGIMDTAVGQGAKLLKEMVSLFAA